MLRVRYVLPKKFEGLTGYTPKAVERKVCDQVWLQGHEYVKGPDGRILIDLDGFERWVRGEPRRGQR